MAKYKVLVQMTKKVGLAARWIEVHAETPKVAIMLAEAKAKAPPSFALTVMAMEVRPVK